MPHPAPWFASTDFTLPRTPEHTPTLLPGNVLVDYLSEEGLYRAWEAAPDRSGHALTFPCSSASSGPLDATERPEGHQFVAIDEAILDYHEQTGEYRVLHCPAHEVRQGFPNPSCRKLGYGTWPVGRVVSYLGAGRVMAWQRSSMAYSLWSFAERGSPLLRNDSTAPFFTPLGEGQLIGPSNASQLLHLRLAQAHTPPPGRAVDVVLEIIPQRGSYRVWNSEGMARGASREASPGGSGGGGGGGGGAVVPGALSPLRGPVSRGAFPSAAPGVRWTTSSNASTLLELDAEQGSYRVIDLSITDLEQLQPSTTTQPPLAFAVKHEGKLDEDAFGSSCGVASTRGDCAALGGACGWCELGAALGGHCMRGGPLGPCTRECASWHFYDTVPPPPPPPAPPPAGGSLSGAQLEALLASTHAAALEARKSVEGATAEGWSVAPSRQAVAEEIDDDSAAVAAAAHARLTLAADQGGAKAGAKPCKQMAEVAALPPPPPPPPACADGADCVALRRSEDPYARGVVVNSEPPRKGRPPAAVSVQPQTQPPTLADMPKKERRPVDSLLSFGKHRVGGNGGGGAGAAGGGAMLPAQHTDMTMPEEAGSREERARAKADKMAAAARAEKAAAAVQAANEEVARLERDAKAGVVKDEAAAAPSAAAAAQARVPGAMALVSISQAQMQAARKAHELERAQKASAKKQERQEARELERAKNAAAKAQERQEARERARAERTAEKKAARQRVAAVDAAADDDDEGSDDEGPVPMGDGTPIATVDPPTLADADNSTAKATEDDDAAGDDDEGAEPMDDGTPIATVDRDMLDDARGDDDTDNATDANVTDGGNDAVAVADGVGMEIADAEGKVATALTKTEGNAPPDTDDQRRADSWLLWDRSNTTAEATANVAAPATATAAANSSGDGYANVVDDDATGDDTDNATDADVTDGGNDAVAVADGVGMGIADAEGKGKVAPNVNDAIGQYWTKWSSEDDKNWELRAQNADPDYLMGRKHNATQYYFDEKHKATHSYFDAKHNATQSYFDEKHNRTQHYYDVKHAETHHYFDVKHNATDTFWERKRAATQHYYDVKHEATKAWFKAMREAADAARRFMNGSAADNSTRFMNGSAADNSTRFLNGSANGSATVPLGGGVAEAPPDDGPQSPLEAAAAAVDVALAQADPSLSKQEIRQVHDAIVRSAPTTGAGPPALEVQLTRRAGAVGGQGSQVTVVPTGQSAKVSYDLGPDPPYAEVVAAREKEAAAAEKAAAEAAAEAAAKAAPWPARDARGGAAPAATQTQTQPPPQQFGFWWGEHAAPQQLAQRPPSADGHVPQRRELPGFG